MFILWRRGNIERPSDLDKGALLAYNRMHVGYCLRVEWDIGGLKRKFRRLMKQLDTTKPKYNQLFWIAAILTNVIHWRRMDFTHDVVGEQLKPAHDHGWD